MSARKRTAPVRVLSAYSVAPSRSTVHTAPPATVGGPARKPGPGQGRAKPGAGRRPDRAPAPGGDAEGPQRAPRPAGGRRHQATEVAAAVAEQPAVGHVHPSTR